MGRRITNGSAQVSDIPVIRITKPNDIFTAQTRERDYECFHGQVNHDHATYRDGGA